MSLNRDQQWLKIHPNFVNPAGKRVVQPQIVHENPGAPVLNHLFTRF
jgi:hypothetical protein